MNLISYLADLQDENLIEKIEKFILTKITKDSKLKLFTAQELLSRAKEANEDYTLGKVMSQEDLEKLSSSW